MRVWSENGRVRALQENGSAIEEFDPETAIRLGRAFQYHGKEMLTEEKKMNELAEEATIAGAFKKVDDAVQAFKAATRQTLFFSEDERKDLAAMQRLRGLLPKNEIRIRLQPAVPVSRTLVQVWRDNHWDEIWASDWNQDIADAILAIPKGDTNV